MSKTPKLRFKEFSGDWEEKKLSELGEFKKTYSFSRSVEGDGIYKHIHYGDIHMNYNGVINKEKYIPSIDIPSNDNYEFVKERDIIFADASEDRKDLGKVAVVKEIGDNVISGLHTICFRPNKTINSEFFLNHSLNNKYLNYMYTKGNGAKVLGISKANLSEYKFLAPSIEEQEKIAYFFSLIDDKISLQGEKLKMLKDYKKGMMQKIFSRELRFKYDDGRDYPEWEENKLGELIYEPTKTKEVEPQKQELLTVKLHCLGIEATGKYPNSTQNGRPYYKRFKGELLIGRQNMHNGGIGIVDDKCNGLIASNAISSYINKEDVSIEFIYYTISRVDYYKRIDLLIGGTGQKEISKKELENLVINTPCLEEQNKIVEFLNKVDIKLEREQYKLDSLNEYKKGLLQQMFV